jgi:hypothetical protein
MIHDKRSSTKYWEDRGYTVVILETKDWFKLYYQKIFLTFLSFYLFIINYCCIFADVYSYPQGQLPESVVDGREIRADKSMNSSERVLLHEKFFL